MKISLYTKLAWESIKKNKRLYIPFLLTCTLMVMICYIILYLKSSEGIANLTGSDFLLPILTIGSFIMAIFACIFLFYTNSFLMRRRKKEFGLYNVLGMSKKNISFVLIAEILIIAVISLSSGLLLGVIFSKLFELGLLNIIKTDLTFDLSISIDSLLYTLEIFGIIFLLILISSVLQVWWSNSISLISSEQRGEKPPKGNWLLGLSGIVILSIAYYLALSIKDPIEAIPVFFFAVVMVIIGTYLILISGSVLLCRLLQKNKHFYFKPDHFISVSSMAYRMKRNGAGLASICILSTMVLVTISTTACLYFGSIDTLERRYPKDINITLTLDNLEDISPENIDALNSEVKAVLNETGIEDLNGYQFAFASTVGFLDESGFISFNGDLDETFNICNFYFIDESGFISFNGDLDETFNICNFYFISLSDYNSIMGTDRVLNPDEALVYLNRLDMKLNKLTFENGPVYNIKNQLEVFPNIGETAMFMVPSIMIVVPDLNQAVLSFQALTDSFFNYKWIDNFDTEMKANEQIALYNSLSSRLESILENENIESQFGIRDINIESREIERQDYNTLFGGLYYLGIILSLIFMFSAILIIYYKQISEGYEDQSRFEIMQKVGMTEQEIRKSINSQLLLVFYLPLLLAICHLIFAFPIIYKLLMLANLDNIIFFGQTVFVCVIGFSLVYMLVYIITSNAYYKIVSNKRDS